MIWHNFIYSYGALDAKIASGKSFPGLEFTAVAGPTHDNYPPFKWSDTNIKEDAIPNFRPIDEFNFTPSIHRWQTFASIASLDLR